MQSHACIMKMNIGGRKTRKTQFFSVLKNSIGLNYLIYEDNFYNSVKLCKNLLHRKKSVWCCED